MSPTPLHAKPFSRACENNKQPLLERLQTLFADCRHVLEIGSGTGQHAVHFARYLPHLTWQSSDQADYLPGIRLWIEESQLSNLPEPLELDVHQSDWPVLRTDAVFSANTAHIMHWSGVEAMFAGVGALLEQGGVFCLYGPFQYGGEHTSESNSRFDSQLRRQDPGMGVRDVHELQSLAADHGLTLEADNAMPANNRTLIWRYN